MKNSHPNSKKGNEIKSANKLNKDNEIDSEELSNLKSKIDEMGFDNLNLNDFLNDLDDGSLDNSQKPYINLESDNIKIELTLKKEYSQTENKKDIKTELKKDINEIIEFFFNSEEFNDLIDYYENLNELENKIIWDDYEPTTNKNKFK